MTNHISINGVSIRTDKNIRHITNNVITFDDGSWCEVSSGKAKFFSRSGKEEGSPSEKESTEPVTITSKYFGRKLTIIGVKANVEVSPTSDDQISITINGNSQRQVDSVSVKKSSDTIFVTSTDAQDKSFISVVTNVIIGNRPKKSLSSVNIIIRVPANTALTVKDVFGDVTVGDINSDVSFVTSKPSTIRAGKVKNATVNITGIGSIDINYVKGNLFVTSSGIGNATIKSGDVETLILKSTGIGNISFLGKAKSGIINCTSIGDIYVSEVTGKCSMNSSGIGTVKIGSQKT